MIVITAAFQSCQRNLLDRFAKDCALPAQTFTRLLLGILLGRQRGKFFNAGGKGPQIDPIGLDNPPLGVPAPVGLSIKAISSLSFRTRKRS